eukprot:1188379-Prorocentrum_minimum.AAC.2
MYTSSGGSSPTPAPTPRDIVEQRRQQTAVTSERRNTYHVEVRVPVGGPVPGNLLEDARLIEAHAADAEERGGGGGDARGSRQAVDGGVRTMDVDVLQEAHLLRGPGRRNIPSRKIGFQPTWLGLWIG